MKALQRVSRSKRTNISGFTSTLDTIQNLEMPMPTHCLPLAKEVKHLSKFFTLSHNNSIYT